MAYNKAREEKKWRLWKEAEEKQLRKPELMKTPLKRSALTIGRFSIQTGGTTSVCRKRVHTLRELPMIRSSPK